MGSMPFALSVHNFISSVGADAGFASIIGLAILVLLYFAHARETSALREQAADLAARLQDAEARLVQASRVAAPAPPPAQASAPATSAEAVRTVPAARPRAVVFPSSAAPFAPAGVAAPALAAATRFVPVAAPVPQPATHAAGSPPVPSVAPGRSASPERPAAPPPASQREPTSPPLAPPEVEPLPAAMPPAPSPAEPVFQPATAAAATAISSSEPPAGTANGGARPGTVRPPRPTAPVAAPSTGRGQSPLQGRRPPYPPLTSTQPRGTSAGRLAGLLIGLLVLGGAVAALLFATSGSGTQNKPSGRRTSNSPGSIPRAPSFNPGSVTVVVLNGTATNQLAHRIAARLGTDGYKEGRVATAADQTKTSTTVAYLRGYRIAAVHVAASLRLGRSAVQPIDQTTRQVACPGAGACVANVVVTVGADLATS